MQDFLRRQLSRVPGAGAISQTARDLQALDPKDAFLALTAAEENQSKIVAGFRFQGSPDDADKIVTVWRQNILGADAPAQQPDSDKHQIRISQAVSTPVFPPFPARPPACPAHPRITSAQSATPG